MSTEAQWAAAEKNLAEIRRTQAEAVMPLIGPMLDAFEMIPNDVLGMDELAKLRRAIEAISSVVIGTEGVA